MIDMRHKPCFLPQISAPVDMVVGKLEEEDVDYDYVEVQPNESDNINPSQGVVFSDGVGEAEIDDMNPIWIAEEDGKDKICDGHHRYIRGLLDNTPIKAIKIKMNFKDACRILNKIQDIYEYEEQQRMEEEVAQDVMNANNEMNTGVSYSEFLNTLEENNVAIQQEKPSKNDKIIIAFRRDPIRENSVVGNFFTLKPVEGFTKYQIDFENLLDTNDLGIQYKDSQVPADVLAKVWFPNINFDKLSEQYDVPAINLKNKAIAEKARILGYDGIKYGDTIIQGLK